MRRQPIRRSRAGSAQRRQAVGSVVVMIALSQLLLAGDCVDGVTPDCSDAAARCGPDVDGSVVEASTTVDAPADVFDAGSDTGADTGPDADAEADADAGDQ